MIARLRKSASALAPDQRLAGGLALLLFVTMFLPWYSRSAVGVVDRRPVAASDSLSAFQVFSFVEAAVLLVAIAVLTLLFHRGERRAFHLPGGDGTVIAGAGIWVCLLVFYRQFDQPEPDNVGGIVADTGVSWGIFITFLVGGALAFSGVRIRAAGHVEPPLPGEPPATSLQKTRVQETRVAERPRRRPQPSVEPDPVDRGDQLSFDDGD